MESVPTVDTKSGFKMPLVGFGTWQATEGELEAALDAALEAGYRHIDTAFVYLNETIIGKVLQKWFTAGKLKREDLFIVTKLPTIGNRPEHVKKFLDISLERLQLSYVDLYLVHTPFGVNYVDDDTIFNFKPDGTTDLDITTDLIGVWKKMEEQVDCGKTRWIGVSNFSAEQVDRILASARIPPVNNQIQLHVYLQQPQLVSHMKANEIVVTSYSTLGSPGTSKFFSALGIEKELTNILSHDVVKNIAEEVEKTPGQVLLRHMIQKDIVVIPKSVNPERIRQNIELFDFELDENQMKRLDDLDENFYIIDFKDLFPGVENHPEYPFA